MHVESVHFLKCVSKEGSSFRYVTLQARGQEKKKKKKKGGGDIREKERREYEEERAEEAEMEGRSQRK